MARAPQLKVFRMAVGFHDAYVAAPSQKAAAAAWGTDTSVFSRKEAELVTDPKLTQEPLARPGEVIKRLRGTAAEQIAALGAEEAQAPIKAKGKPPAQARPGKPPKPKPRPSRGALDQAEREVEAAEARHREERAVIAARQAELERERKAMDKKQREEKERLEARRDKAAAAYEQAMQRWREA